MKVYTLLGFWDYEGSELVGVFATRDDAIVYVSKMERKPYHSMGVVESELGAAVGDVDTLVEYL